MIAFKEYVNLGFQYIIAERIKSSLLFYFGTPKEFLKFFNFSPNFLNSLDDTTGTSFFKEEQKKIKKAFKENKIDIGELTPFELFKEDIKSNKKYYDLAFYYLKESELTPGMTKIDLNKEKVYEDNSEDAALEFFSHELYKIAKEVHKDILETDYYQMKKLEYDDIKNYSLSTVGNITVINFNDKNKYRSNIPISAWRDVYSKIREARVEMNEYLDKNLISLIDNV